MKKTSIAIFCIVLCSFILIAPCLAGYDSEVQNAVDVSSQVVNLGQPFNKSPYVRNVWDMQVYNGRIYLGHGNSANSAPSPNAGPIPVIYYDPQSNKFVTEYTVNDEEIQSYKIINGKLTIPGTDARESWDFGNYYVLDNGTWLKNRTIPNAEHVMDMASFNGQLYSANGTTATSKGEVMTSKDGGKTWASVMPGVCGPFMVTEYVNNLFEFKNKLYAASQFFKQDADPANNMLVIDGTSTSTVKILTSKMMPGCQAGFSYKMLRVNVVNNNLVYLGVKTSNDMQWNPDAMYVASDINQARRITFPEPQALPTDILVRGGTTYVSTFKQISSTHYQNIVYKSTDLQNWTEVFRFTSDTFARSFEELNGDFYFGLGCYVNKLTESTGSILKVPSSAYNRINILTADYPVAL